MKDFRERVVQRPPNQADVENLLRKGLLIKAIRKARLAGIDIPQREINSTAKAMFHKGQAGALLSMIDKMDVTLPYDVKSLLIRSFEVRDYHTFLKQVFRLGKAADHRLRIKYAINAIERTAPREANDWRRKFGVK